MKSQAELAKGVGGTDHRGTNTAAAIRMHTDFSLCELRLLRSEPSNLIQITEYNISIIWHITTEEMVELIRNGYNK